MFSGGNFDNTVNPPLDSLPNEVLFSIVGNLNELNKAKIASTSQLFHSMVERTKKPRALISPEKSIYVKDHQTFTITHEGKVYACGKNDLGQLGLGHQHNVSVPTLNPYLKNICDIQNYYDHFIYLDTHGNVFVSGENSSCFNLGSQKNILIPTRLASLSNICQMAINDAHYFFLDNAGQVWGCTHSYDPYLGTGRRTVSQPITQLSVKNIKKIITYERNTFFIGHDGTIWVCGSNTWAQLGVGHRNDVYYPTLISLDHVDDIFCTHDQTYFLKQGEVWFTGSYFGIYPAPRNYVFSPRKIPNLTGIISVINAYNHCYLLDKNGDVFYFSTYVSPDSTAPIKLADLKNIKKIFCDSYDRAFFLDKDGNVFALGSNYYAELGMGSYPTNVTKPTQLPLQNICHIASSFYNTLFVRTDGVIFGCGKNEYNELGVAHEQFMPQSKPTLSQLQIVSTKHLTLSSPYFQKLEAEVGAIVAKLKKGHFRFFNLGKLDKAKEIEAAFARMKKIIPDFYFISIDELLDYKPSENTLSLRQALDIKRLWVNKEAQSLREVRKEMGLSFR